MNLTAGGTSGDSFTGSAMIVNASASLYGGGWSIGGLQQITTGIPGQTLMITNGSGTRGIHVQ